MYTHENNIEMKITRSLKCKNVKLILSYSCTGVPFRLPHHDLSSYLDFDLSRT